MANAREGLDGFTTATGTEAEVTVIDKSLTTARPRSRGEIEYAEKATGLQFKYAYWGRYVGNHLQIMGKFSLK